MAENSKIEWTTHTANLWWGCVKVSDLCDHCYADDLDRRYGPSHFGLDAPRRFIKSVWNDVPKWNAASDPANPARVFWMSMGDLFELLPEGHPDRQQMEEVRQRGFRLMEDTPKLHHLLLTKRISNVRKMVPEGWLTAWPAHIRIGVSVGTQKDADRDIPRLLDLPCPNFLSMEPLLERVSLAPWLFTTCRRCEGEGGGKNFGSISLDDGAWDCEECDGTGLVPEGPMKPIQWVITGGESGPKARPSHPDWFRLLRDECEKAGVPFLYKRWGEWVPEGQTPLDTIVPSSYRSDARTGTMRLGKKVAGRLLDGREWNEFPEAPTCHP